MATLHGTIVNSAMAGAYSQPDCGSAANGVPPNRKGFHAGMWPALSALPRKQ